MKMVKKGLGPDLVCEQHQKPGQNTQQKEPRQNNRSALPKFDKLINNLSFKFWAWTQRVKTKNYFILCVWSGLFYLSFIFFHFFAIFLFLFYLFYLSFSRDKLKQSVLLCTGSNRIVFFFTCGPNWTQVCSHK